MSFSILRIDRHRNGSMRASGVFDAFFRYLIAAALIGSVYVYLYPALNGCAFTPPTAGSVEQPPGAPTHVAPFRLLALGDPQLEGDSSLPDPNEPLFPSLETLKSRVFEGDVWAAFWGLGETAIGFVLEDLWGIVKAQRKRVDLWGNDFYLAHIYRSLVWWAEPTHTVVLGDLLGSQWISNEEFERRSTRFWERVFKHAERVPREITEASGRTEVLGHDPKWSRRIIAVVGNHDIGYAGDLNHTRIERFEREYGSVNWEIRFDLRNASDESGPSPSPQLRLIIFNSMNIDDPALHKDLQKVSRDFIADRAFIQSASPTTATFLLTHIPFYKQEGVCVDPPFFSHFEPFEGGGMKEQNHLSRPWTDYILTGLDRQGTVLALNGHDHEGCDTIHHRSAGRHPGEDEGQAPHWESHRFGSRHDDPSASTARGIREITVRSMMGSFGGHAGLLSAWFDADAQRWQYEFKDCMFGVQHIWWAVHVVDLLVVVLFVGRGVAAGWERLNAKREGDGKVKTT